MKTKIILILVATLFIASGFVPCVMGRNVQDEFKIQRLNINLTKGLLNGYIELTYDLDDIPSTIRPESDIVRVDLYINYFVSGRLSRFLVPFLHFLKSGTVPIELTIEDVPEYISASVAPKVVYSPIDIEKTETPEHAIVTIHCTKNAPAFQPQEIFVKAKASSVKGPFRIIDIIASAENEIAIEIKPGYYSSFVYEYQTYAETSPGKTIIIPINITSYSNARSRLIFEIVDPPEGWSASFNSEMFIGTAVLGENPTVTANITIRSPGERGYHNEVEHFTVHVRTMAAGHPDQGIDNSTYLQFTVRSKGWKMNSFIESFPLIDVQNSIENMKYKSHLI